MKTKLFLIGLLFLLFISSCTSPKYLPDTDYIDINTYGSYIYVYKIKKERIKGELISVDEKDIVVLTSKKIKGKKIKTIVTIPVNEIKRYSLKYAKPKHYGITIPIFTLVSISHGILGVLTMPINLITSIIITSTGSTDFKYVSSKMTYKKLNMFARFPQGIPPNIDIKKIK